MRESRFIAAIRLALTGEQGDVAEFLGAGSVGRKGADQAGLNASLAAFGLRAE